MSLPGGKRVHPQSRLLLHVCCAPCSTHVIDVLRRKFAVIAFFYNPNIYPPQEHRRRAQQARRLCRRLGVKNLIDECDGHNWSRRMRGRQADREGGAHCVVCFWMRLARTAAVAEEQGFDYFATTLTVSPHKDAQSINRMGQRAARGLKTEFYAADFKKDSGFEKSCQLSQEYGLYRQDYCGCIYSLQERNERKAEASGPLKTRARRQG
jgi:predicted adenine nucleotide alpha hydrolase (AANH) superfamily ATPase